jgi:hypothetical protein
MNPISRTFLAGALAAAALGASAQQPEHVGALWPVDTPSDHAFFCGTQGADADGTAPLGYAKRLSIALDALGGRNDAGKAMDQLAQRARCPRDQWAQVGGKSPSNTTLGTPPEVDTWGLLWPGNSPQDIAWLCQAHRENDPPANYPRRVTRAVVARVDAGMPLADVPGDIRRMAGCPISGSVASQR